MTSMRKEMKPGPRGETREAVAEVAGGPDANGPRKMTFAENVILTIKVLAGFGVLGAALWGIDLWTAVK
jgi:hypothetical protein